MERKRTQTENSIIPVVWLAFPQVRKWVSEEYLTSLKTSFDPLFHSPLSRRMSFSLNERWEWRKVSQRNTKKRQGSVERQKRRNEKTVEKRIVRPVYRKKGEAVVETNSKIDVGERTCNLYLGWEVKMYNVGVMLKRKVESL